VSLKYEPASEPLHISDQRSTQQQQQQQGQPQLGQQQPQQTQQGQGFFGGNQVSNLICK